VIAYASRTGTRRNLAALRDAGWRLLISATGVWRDEGFPYAIDNGAWTAHQSGAQWNQGAFEELVSRMGQAADWTVLPDIVMGGLPSLGLSISWLDRVDGRVLIPLQDGMRPRHVEHYLSGRVGLFVGGSTEWKEASLPMWGAVKRRTGCWLHVGRVNSARRIRLCALAGADSFDGSGPSRFSACLPRLDRARRQGVLFEDA
jgi:hypothetical protein